MGPLATTPMLTRHLAALLLVGALWGLPSCGTEILYVDPPFSYDVSHTGCGGELAVFMGMYEEQIYNDFTEVAELSIVDGLQGGTWCMPAIRTWGLKNPVRLKATVTTSEGEQVGLTVLQNLRLILSPDGACEVLALPIPITHPSNPTAEIDDLFGKEARIEVEIRDADGVVGKHAADIKLVQG
ncbi:MAG: hypothetical protein KC502_06760 [Myxococcales bacterium]|nr:hypothetical protein [Myxococcales bacterium]